jgi:hypothetical protein
MAKFVLAEGDIVTWFFDKDFLVICEHTGQWDDVPLLVEVQRWPQRVQAAA